MPKKNKFLTFTFAYAVFGYYFIAFLPDLLNLESRQITIPYRASVVILVIFISLYKLDDLKINKYFATLITFWIMYILKILYYTLVTNQVFDYSNTEIYIYAIGMCFIPMLFFYKIFNDINIKLLIKYSFYFVFIPSILALSLNIDLFLQGITRIKPTQSLNPITFGHLSVHLVLISLYALKTKVINKLFAFCGLLLGFVNIYFAGSKTPLIALVICFVLLALSSKEKSLKTIKILILLLLSILIVLVVYYRDDVYLLVRFVTVYENLQSGDDVRLLLWLDAISEFQKNIFIGGSIELPTWKCYPHQLLLEVLMSTGLIGFLLFFIAFRKVLKNAVRLFNSIEFGWIGLIFIQYAIMAMTSFSLYTINSFWYLFAYLLSKQYIKNKLIIRKVRSFGN